MKISFADVRSATEREQKTPSVRLQVSTPSGLLPFEVMRAGVILRGPPVSPHDRVEFDAMIDESHVSFLARGISNDDDVRINLVSNWALEALFRHGKPPLHCQVLCADGSTGSPCVVCKSDGIVIRVCC